MNRVEAKEQELKIRKAVVADRERQLSSIERKDGAECYRNDSISARARSDIVVRRFLRVFPQ